MTNREWLRTLSDEQLAEWLEDHMEAYVRFWIMPDCDFSHREEDKEILLNMLRSEHIGEVEF